MANAIVNIFKVPELRNRILFTLIILIIYRIGCHIPIPGINVEALKGYFEQMAKSGSGGILNLFDLFAGGALKRFTIFALGIMPYITASIIMQLLNVVIPALERLAKEGAEGRKKINQYTRYGTVIICALQSLGLTFWMRSMSSSKGAVVPKDSGIMFVIIAVAAITTGTLILMWLGELITEKGIGNGISLIIFAGIVVRVPAAVVETANRIIDRGNPILLIILLVLFFGVTAASILLTLGVRKIPVQYGKRVVGRRMVQMKSQAIPLRVNAAGVIPIIFASSIVLLPSQFGNMLGVNKYAIFNKIQFWLSPGQISYMIFYGLLIIFFCYFYTAIQFNPVDIAENLKKYGGFIPGIRPGQKTSDFIMRILNRVTLSGSIFLAVIAIVPDFIMRIWPEEISPEMAYLFGGTSLLIIVGVALDTVKQIESQLMMRHYDGFSKKGRIKGRYS
ncbi:MAG: preprotein translocase subunit SecY [Spirochaetes bacterium]|nr:preprotein translocase subunit SecY [Spirochaetota bacterium]